MIELQVIEQESRLAAMEICEASGIKRGEIFVVGCSSSEVLGDRIGTATNVGVAEAIYNGIAPVLEEKGIYLAGQCCEHLNRALVIEEKALERYGFEQVNAIPQPNHAGGAFATVCYQRMENPVLTESIRMQATAGIDIGGTMIGMHIHPTVVPLRISLRKIGEAGIICARRRPRYIGGARTVYDERLM
jgi:uncharacterized protein (TIGR01440 family)